MFAGGERKMIQTSFKRYEKKYKITEKQKEMLCEDMKKYMREDDYGKYSLCNIYYDTPDMKLIRAPLEKPIYKEKLRVRSYGVPKLGEKIFVEIKKKYDGIVYKRRISAMPAEAAVLLAGSLSGEHFGQIGKEISAFQQFYKTEPKVYIGYDREAYAGIFDPNLRITFDCNMRYRTDRLDLRYGDYGKYFFDGDYLCEIKFASACPLWLSEFLSENGIFPTSFSKYGTVYREEIMKGENETKKEGIFCA